jgi:hypothetical protein
MIESPTAARPTAEVSLGARSTALSGVGIAATWC